MDEIVLNRCFEWDLCSQSTDQVVDLSRDNLTYNGRRWITDTLLKELLPDFLKLINNDFLDRLKCEEYNDSLYMQYFNYCMTLFCCHLTLYNTEYLKSLELPIYMASYNQSKITADKIFTTENLVLVTGFKTNGLNVIAEFEKFNMDEYEEVVFCGFGEPTERFDVLIKVAEYVKKTYGKKTRINTNGVGNLVNGRDIVPEMEGLIDTISISLNNPHKDEYNALVRSKFGEKSFDEMISFAKECTRYIPNVVLTTVDTTISHEEEAECQKLCDEIGAAYRIRPWED